MCDILFQLRNITHRRFTVLNFFKLTHGLFIEDFSVNKIGNNSLLISCYMRITMQRISFNIGGIRFETEEATLRKFPESRLAQEYSGVNEIFYDRNPYIFSFILDCYRYGSLHLPHDICSTYLQAEVEFWRIPLDVVQPLF